MVAGDMPGAEPEAEDFPPVMQAGSVVVSTAGLWAFTMPAAFTMAADITTTAPIGPTTDRVSILDSAATLITMATQLMGTRTVPMHTDTIPMLTAAIPRRRPLSRITVISRATRRKGKDKLRLHPSSSPNLSPNINRHLRRLSRSRLMKATSLSST
jgi:hypothetical protein